MTQRSSAASATDYSPFIPPAPRRHRSEQKRRAARVTAPFEGWLSLLLLIVMGMMLGFSLDDARWVLGRDGLTDFLPFAVAGGIIWGFVAAKAEWPPLRSHLLGALFAALLVPLAVGASLVDHFSLRDWYVATANSSVEAYLDLAWRGRTLTQQYGHFVLILGLLCWGTGQYAGYAAFGHHRPMNAVMLLGVALVTNMAITVRDQLPFLVIYTLAALLFLIRLHAAEERSTWIRRHIGDPKAISALYVRGGVAFVTAAVLGSLVLTATASSAPLANAWSGIDQNLIGIGQTLQRFFPAGGPGTRIQGIAFGQSSAITGRWVTDNTPALTITVPPDDEHIYYWRAIAYDRFDLNGWSLSGNNSTTVDPGYVILGGTREEEAATAVTRDVSFAVTPLAYRGTTVFSPYAPAVLDHQVRASLLGGQFLSTVDLASAGPYVVTAQVPATTLDDPDGLTENRLRAAGRQYPPEIQNFYTPLSLGAIGPKMRELRDTILSVTPGDDPTPYDIARSTVAYLRSDVFTYSTDVTDIKCGDRSVAECFAEFRAGYCQHYATTMAVLMRMQNIPARLVQGFLPGERDANGNETIRYSNSHAWVEVFFPGYGWVAFDPTGGGVAQLEPLPAGPPVSNIRPSLPPASVSGLSEDDLDPINRLPLPESTATNPTSDSLLSRTPIVTIAVLLGIVVAAAAFVAWRRSRRRELQPEAVYGGMTRWASMLGFRPRPTETVYEYTAALGQAVPRVRPELSVVANAKVDVAYGRRQLGDERMRALRDAQRRVRIGLLRLATRRRRGR